MSDIKFTPGPWNCKGAHPEGCAVYVDPGDDPGFGDVAVIYRVLRSDEQVQADARLIAAAPDMYAALGAARDTLAELPDEDDERDRDLLALIDAALAKAVGQ